MTFELLEVVAKLKDVKPRKKGKADDAPLVVVLPFELDLAAKDVLALFHPTLRHFLYAEKCARFTPYLESINWTEEHSNMELEIAGLTLQADKIGKYKISPYHTGNEDPDISDRLVLRLQATIDLGQDSKPIALLSELINTDVPISVRASQLNLLDNQEEKPAPILDIKTKKRKVPNTH